MGHVGHDELLLGQQRSNGLRKILLVHLVLENFIHNAGSPSSDAALHLRTPILSTALRWKPHNLYKICTYTVMQAEW
jgi:hypothetical protein